jgi:hypothetical protein
MYKEEKFILSHSFGSSFGPIVRQHIMAGLYDRVKLPPHGWKVRRKYRKIPRSYNLLQAHSDQRPSTWLFFLKVLPPPSSAMDSGQNL